MAVTFNVPVVVRTGAVLLLDVGDSASSPAEAAYLSGNGSDSLTFMYNAADGHETKDLGTYDEGDNELGGGLIGTILRYSDSPSQVCLAHKCWCFS